MTDTPWTPDDGRIWHENTGTMPDTGDKPIQVLLRSARERRRHHSGQSSLASAWGWSIAEDHDYDIAAWAYDDPADDPAFDGTITGHIIKHGPAPTALDDWPEDAHAALRMPRGPVVRRRGADDSARRYTVTPALQRRIDALGYEPGDCDPVAWLVAELTEARAALAAERGEPEGALPGWVPLWPDEDVRWVKDPTDGYDPHGEHKRPIAYHEATAEWLWWVPDMPHAEKAPTALAAMRAADAYMKECDDG